jgi:hypothetical protein
LPLVRPSRQPRSHRIQVILPPLCRRGHLGSLCRDRRCLQIANACGRPASGPCAALSKHAVLSIFVCVGTQRRLRCVAPRRRFAIVVVSADLLVLFL